MATLPLARFGFVGHCVPFFLLVDDLERNEGSAARPFFVSSSLMKILLDTDS